MADNPAKGAERERMRREKDKERESGNLVLEELRS